MFKVICFKKHGEYYEKRIYLVKSYDKYINDHNEVFIILEFNEGNRITLAEKVFDEIEIKPEY